MSFLDRHFLKQALRWIFDRVACVETQGVEFIPGSGGCLLTTNHMSRLDSAFLLMTSPRDDMRALVADKYRFNPFFTLFVRATDSIWINRDVADHTAMRAAADHLRSGGMLGIAPEGTRSRIGKMIQGKSGAALLVEKEHVPVVPVAITGSESTMADLLHFRRPVIGISFGPPYFLPPLERLDRSGSVSRNTDEIMCRIAALMPEKYHGYYLGHPRILEIRKGIGL